MSLVDCIRDSAASDKKYGRRVPARRKSPSEAYRQIPAVSGITALMVKGSLQRSALRPDLILVTSVMTYWYKGVFWCIEQLKDLLPGSR